MKLIRTDSREKKALRQAFLRFLPIPIVLVVIASVFISYSDYNDRKQQILSQQQDQIIAAMIDYRNHISDMTSITRNIETDAIDIPETGRMQHALETLFLSRIRQYPVIDEMSLLDINGMEILRVSRENGQLHLLDADMLMDQSNQAYYTEVTALSRHQFLFSGLDLNLDRGVLEIDPATGRTGTGTAHQYAVDFAAGNGPATSWLIF